MLIFLFKNDEDGNLLGVYTAISSDKSDQNTRGVIFLWGLGESIKPVPATSRDSQDHGSVTR